MACNRPLFGFMPYDGGKFQFTRSDTVLRGTPLSAVPCGRCRGCRREYGREWSIRIMHEAQMHESNCFITLTYDDAHYPEHGTLVPEHWTLFMKRLRKCFSGTLFKFYMCGEYGDKRFRPHYHAALLGLSFPDLVPAGSSKLNFFLFESQILNEVWGKGRCIVNALTFESAAYVALYMLKKQKGDFKGVAWPDMAFFESITKRMGAKLSRDEYDAWLDDALNSYNWRYPEFCRMSKGIGKSWITAYLSDVYPYDEVIKDGYRIKPPRYYDNFLKEFDESAYLQMKANRAVKARTKAVAFFPEFARRDTKEELASIKQSVFSREFEYE
jgi:hypothetical protein